MLTRADNHLVSICFISSAHASSRMCYKLRHSWHQEETSRMPASALHAAEQPTIRVLQVTVHILTKARLPLLQDEGEH